MTRPHECPICGLPEPPAGHPDCEEADTVEPYRPTPAPEQRRGAFSDSVVDKAHRYVADGAVRPLDATTWEVRGSTTYRVRTDASADTGSVSWASCSCPHGTKAPMEFPRCSHLAAVLIHVKRGDRLCGQQYQTTTPYGVDTCRHFADHEGPHRGAVAEWWQGARATVARALPPEEV